MKTKDLFLAKKWWNDPEPTPTPSTTLLYALLF